MESRRLARNSRDRVKFPVLPFTPSCSRTLPLCPLEITGPGDFGNVRVRRSTPGREVKRFYGADYMHYFCAGRKPRRNGR